jgi:hypothetical protein
MHPTPLKIDVLSLFVIDQGRVNTDIYLEDHSLPRAKFNSLENASKYFYYVSTV